MFVSLEVTYWERIACGCRVSFFIYVADVYLIFKGNGYTHETTDVLAKFTKCNLRFQCLSRLRSQFISTSCEYFFPLFFLCSTERVTYRSFFAFVPWLNLYFISFYRYKCDNFIVFRFRQKFSFLAGTSPHPTHFAEEWKIKMTGIKYKWQQTMSCFVKHLNVCHVIVMCQ